MTPRVIASKCAFWYLTRRSSLAAVWQNGLKGV